MWDFLLGKHGDAFPERLASVCWIRGLRAVRNHEYAVPKMQPGAAGPWKQSAAKRNGLRKGNVRVQAENGRRRGAARMQVGE